MFINQFTYVRLNNYKIAITSVMDLSAIARLTPVFPERLPSLRMSQFPNVSRDRRYNLFSSRFVHLGRLKTRIVI